MYNKGYLPAPVTWLRGVGIAKIFSVKTSHTHTIVKAEKIAIFSPEKGQGGKPYSVGSFPEIEIRPFLRRRSSFKPYGFFFTTYSCLILQLSDLTVV